jgi:ribosomal protein S18 acetylase RimI-like enzyme
MELIIREATPFDMDKIHHWAISKGADDVELNVYEFNQGAIAFYRQLGYETISQKIVNRCRFRFDA